jgi:hypothetical protein
MNKVNLNAKEQIAQYIKEEHWCVARDDNEMVWAEELLDKITDTDEIYKTDIFCETRRIWILTTKGNNRAMWRVQLTH